MIEALRRVTVVELSSPCFAPIGSGSEHPAPTQQLVLHPLQSTYVDISFTLCVTRDGHGGTKEDTGAFPPPPLSMRAAKHFLAAFGEDDICRAWTAAIRRMILVPFVLPRDGVSYAHYQRQAAAAVPQSMHENGFFTAETPMGYDPLLPPMELEGTTSGGLGDRDPSTLKSDPSAPHGIRVLSALASGEIPKPRVTFRLPFAVPCVEGDSLLGIACTLLNAPAVVAASALPFGCLSLGTAFAEASLERLVDVACSSRFIGPNRVLVGCTVSTHPREGAASARHRNVFLTSLYLDLASSWLGRSLASLGGQRHDPQHRVAAPHQHTPLIQALVRCIDVTPLRSAGDAFPITLRRYDAHCFAFVVELKAEFAYLAQHAARVATAPPKSILHRPTASNTMRPSAMQSPRSVRDSIQGRGQRGRDEARDGCLGIAAGIHQREIAERAAQRSVQGSRLALQAAAGTVAAHQRTNSSILLSWRRAAPVTVQKLPATPSGDNATPLSRTPSAGPIHSRGPSMAFSDDALRSPLMKGTTSSTSPLLAYQQSRPEDLLLEHLLAEVIHTGVVLTYEIDGREGDGGAATLPVRLRWETEVEWSFSPKHYDGGKGIVLADPTPLEDRHEATDYGWTLVQTPMGS